MKIKKYHLDNTPIRSKTLSEKGWTTLENRNRMSGRKVVNGQQKKENPPPPPVHIVG